MPTLTWTGKDQAVIAARGVPFRLLEPHEAGVSQGLHHPASDNLLIQGDNLEALKALLPYCAGRVKCIYIDPPYNTGSAFEHYDDNLEHSTWLSMMYPRLELLRELLAEDGSIWISIDDDECHYMKVIMDEIFGRINFIANVIWQKKFSPQNDAKYLSDMHDHILLYAKRKQNWGPNLLLRSTKQATNLKNPDNDIRGPWYSADYTCAKSKDERPNLYFPIVNPNTQKLIFPKATRIWAFDKSTHEKNVDNGFIYWGVAGTNDVPRLKKFPDSVRAGTVPTTIWFHDEVGNNQEAKREILVHNSSDPFTTPKPERLIKRILEIATNPGDLVLDSFLGSGTTAAVAHKMGRRWIGVEMGDHAVTHCLPRLKKVLEGEQGGISEAVGWKGGGGFRFLKLGETVFLPDGALNPKVSFKALAAHIYWRETGRPLSGEAASPLLGVDQGRAYYLVYNGILGDMTAITGNVLSLNLLGKLPRHVGPRVVFAEACSVPPATLKALDVTFRHIPYDLGGLHA